MSEHEIKYIINNGRARQVIAWLNAFCHSDPEFPEGMVSSIYFDTRNWRFLSEKANSDFYKMKIRVRWYSDLKYQNHSHVSFVEAKQKIGARRKKIRITSELSGEWLSSTRLENPKLLTLPGLLYAKGIIWDNHIFPVFQISYKRLRFIDPYSRSRICLDFDINAPRSNSFMLPKFNPFPLSTAVFELKGKLRELPFSLHPLIKMGLRKSSYSKYSACYHKLTQIN